MNARQEGTLGLVEAALGQKTLQHDIAFVHDIEFIKVEWLDLWFKIENGTLSVHQSRNALVGEYWVVTPTSQLLQQLLRTHREKEELQKRVIEHEEDCAVLPKNFSVTETVTVLRKENYEMIDSLIKTRARLRDAPHDHVFGECNLCTIMDELEEQFPKLREVEDDEATPQTDG